MGAAGIENVKLPEKTCSVAYIHVYLSTYPRNDPGPNESHKFLRVCGVHFAPQPFLTSGLSLKYKITGI